MKNISIYGVLVLVLFGFSACDDKGKASYSDSSVILGVGDSSVVSDGDSLTPLSSDTRIEVIHNINQDTKQVTILSGEAALISGNYEITNN